MSERVIDREALAGVAIAGGFGLAWAFWAAAGLTGGTAATVRIAGVVLGALIVAGALWRLRVGGAVAARRGSDSMFRSRGYLVWVAVEVIALFGGNAALGASGHSAYVAAWTALVVGLHFLGFGRLFAPIFYAVGAAFVVAAVVGAIAGVVADPRHAVEASTGLVAAATLFAAGGWGLLASPPSELAVD